MEKHFSAAWEQHVLSAVQHEYVLSDLGCVSTSHSAAQPFGTEAVSGDVPHCSSAGLGELHACVCVLVVISVLAEGSFQQKLFHKSLLNKRSRNLR